MPKERNKHQYSRDPLRPSPSKMLQNWTTNDSSTKWRDDKQNCVDADHLPELMSEIHVLDAGGTKSEGPSSSKSLEISRNEDTGISLTDCAAEARYG
jgi:hypothetical protein